MWQRLRLLCGGRWKEESQEHLCTEGLGLLGTRWWWWWSHQPGSETSCPPSRATWDMMLSPSGPLLFSVTAEASACCCPLQKDPQAVTSGQADGTAGQTDSSTLPLEGTCPKPAGEDMPAALHRGCGRGASSPENLLPYGALVLGHV